MTQSEDSEDAFVRELNRVLGPPDGSVLYSIGTDGLGLEENLERLRKLPSGIGYHEMMRRLGLAPPDESQGTRGNSL